MPQRGRFWGGGFDNPDLYGNQVRLNRAAARVYRDFKAAATLGGAAVVSNYRSQFKKSSNLRGSKRSRDGVVKELFPLGQSTIPESIGGEMAAKRRLAKKSKGGRKSKGGKRSLSDSVTQSGKCSLALAGFVATKQEALIPASKFTWTSEIDLVNIPGHVILGEFEHFRPGLQSSYTSTNTTPAVSTGLGTSQIQSGVTSNDALNVAFSATSDTAGGPPTLQNSVATTYVVAGGSQKYTLWNCGIVAAVVDIWVVRPKVYSDSVSGFLQEMSYAGQSSTVACGPTVTVGAVAYDDIAFQPFKQPEINKNWRRVFKKSVTIEPGQQTYFYVKHNGFRYDNAVLYDTTNLSNTVGVTTQTPTATNWPKGQFHVVFKSRGAMAYDQNIHATTLAPAQVKVICQGSFCAKMGCIFKQKVWLCKTVAASNIDYSVAVGALTDVITFVNPTNEAVEIEPTGENGVQFGAG